MIRCTLLLLLSLACSKPSHVESTPPALRHDYGEPHLANVEQLTFGGENAEAYWSSDGTELIFQSTREPYQCDQIFRMLRGGIAQLVSTGRGKTTCSYFFPGDQRVLYASTQHLGNECPPPPDHSLGYVWPLYDYDIMSAKPDGSEPKALIESTGYDAEATICPKDGSIIFTSTRDGDLELYRADSDGSNVVRLTREPGYDGGAFFSADCTKIVWRASRPHGKEIDDYRSLLEKRLVRPTSLELMVANADGSDARQVTYLHAASFAPSFFPSGNRIIFSSNVGDPKGREFDIWAINTDGTGLEQITHAPGFDGFPMFSSDGHRLAFASNRDQKKQGETNVYVAEWREGDASEPQQERAADRFRADVGWLADDAREGRGLGTRGLAQAAKWLASRFETMGLETHSQPFQVRVGATVGAQTSLALDGKPSELSPLGLSSSGRASGDIVFAGYGITAPELSVDDYKGLNVKGKIVLLRLFSPENGVFVEANAQRKYSDLHFKAFNAREHGAAAVLLADLPDGKEAPAEAPARALLVEPFGDAGLPVARVPRDVGQKLLVGKHKATLEVALEHQYAPAENLIGKISAGAEHKLPGAVVVGAHYDHLGMGDESSLAPGVTAVHNGADDNASGVAALLEVARALKARQSELSRDVYVVAFSAEEKGVIGSTQFTRTPPAGLATSDVVAMLNMDMVGRMRKNHVIVDGGESAEEWNAIVPLACEAAGIACSLGGGGYGPSDQTPFYAAGIPGLHFFTGAHSDYHKPSDDVDRINAGGGAQIAHLVAELAVSLTGRETKLTYRAMPAPLPLGDSRSYGASLGTVPDYAGPPEGQLGVLLAGVRPGGPAEAAGLQRGDTIIRIGSNEVRSVEDLMFVLNRAKPGEKATVLFMRDGKETQVEATFGQRTHAK